MDSHTISTSSAIVGYDILCMLQGEEILSQRSQDSEEEEEDEEPRSVLPTEQSEEEVPAISSISKQL